jgi:hypothetical protein
MQKRRRTSRDGASIDRQTSPTLRSRPKSAGAAEKTRAEPARRGTNLQQKAFNRQRGYCNKREKMESKE